MNLTAIDINRHTKVLCIDDEEMIRCTISDYLEDSGYTVIQAENGKAGLALFNEENPDIVLVDLRMPEVDGLNVLSTVTRQSPNTPVIVVSGTGALQDVIEALRLGAWNYLTKPIEDMAVLEYAVKSALEKSRLVKDNENYRIKLEDMVRERTVELEEANRRLLVTLDEITRAKQELLKSEEKYRGIFDNIQDIYMEVDFDGNIIEVSPSVEKQLLYSREELIGKSVRRLQKNSKDTKEFAYEIQKHSKLTDYEILLKTKNDDFVFFSINSSLIRDRNGRPDKIISSMRNIDEKKRLETQLQQAQKMEAIGTLAGGIAHDFNNILAAIMGYTEILGYSFNDADPAKDKTEKILKACMRAKDLVKQILSFSRQTETEQKPVQIHLIVKEALKLLRASIPSTIEIKHKLDYSSDTVMADPTQIHQILMNLCANASHAMREKGGTLTVELSNVTLKEKDISFDMDLKPGEFIKLSVTDTGHGIMPETIQRIFDPYFTTKQKGEGTGLGLSVVHGIVKKHKGVIDVESERHKGSSFHIFLPVIPFEQPRPSLEPSALPGGSERILLVDDEPVLVMMLQEMLTHLGYQVFPAVNPEDALVAFSKTPYDFDVVITDMTMPKMTGDILAKKILEIRKDTPIILCTGFSEKMNLNLASAMGFKDFVMKPVLIKDISHTIRKALGKK